MVSVFHNIFFVNLVASLRELKKQSKIHAPSAKHRNFFKIFKIFNIFAEKQQKIFKFFLIHHLSQQLVHQILTAVGKISEYTTTVLTAILYWTNCVPPPWFNICYQMSLYVTIFFNFLVFHLPMLHTLFCFYKKLRMGGRPKSFLKFAIF